MIVLRIHEISRMFDQNPVLKTISLEVQQGEIMCLLGPSGCGKTTLLRIIAGLERADSGDIDFEGQSIMSVAVHERGFGLMFQDFALFPHMTVRQNIAFGLRHYGHAEVDRRVKESLDLVGLAGFEQRDVTRLSGGEKQRVALARSLAPRPRLLMLDEPLGSLDAALRERLALELRAIIKQVGLTAIYVTHDQEEAFAIADRVALMNAGHIEQVDTPERIYLQPRTEFAARFLGLQNIIPVNRCEDGRADTALGAFSVDAACQSLLLHPLGVEIVDAETPGAISVRIAERVFRGDSYRFEAQHASGHRLIFYVPALRDAAPQRGDQIWLRILPQAVIALSTA